MFYNRTFRTKGTELQFRLFTDSTVPTDYRGIDHSPLA